MEKKIFELKNSAAFILQFAAHQYGKKTAAYEINTEQSSFIKEEVCFLTLEEQVKKFASHLQHLGIKHGDCVGLMAENSLDFIRAWFGIVYAGGCVVPIPILSPIPEVVFRLEKTQSKYLVLDEKRNHITSEISAACSIPSIPVSSLAHSINHTFYPSFHYTKPEDPAMILFTSGTTATPKGAVITHRSLLTHTSQLVEHTLKLTSKDRVLAVLPLTHSFGLRMAMLAPLIAGSTIFLLPRFQAKNSLRIISEEKISWLPAVPTMFYAWHKILQLENHPKTFHIKWCLSAGAPIAQKPLKNIEKKLSTEIRQGYGLTEATFSTINAPTESRDTKSVGKPVHGVQIQIVDDNYKPLPTHQEGQILVRGPNVMKEYLHDAQATREAFWQGWLLTGDIGYLDHEGKLFIKDRLKDLILRGGNNVYPSEVEQVLLKHSCIHEAAVVGEPDTYYGENVVAVIVLQSGCSLSLQEIDQLCRKYLAPHKVPRKIAFVETLPQGASNKVLKRKLRQMLLQQKLVLHEI